MNRRGFTLIEVLASVVLIAVAIIPVAEALTQGLVISAKEERLTKVIFLADRKMEEIIGKVIYDYNTDRDESGNFSEYGDLDPSYSEYKYTVDDSVIEDNDSKLKKIEVKVWHDDGESITLDTKIAERD